ncbi:MAG: hypothetical protein ACREKL_11440 [Chthoniobacterales bacterium]
MNSNFLKALPVVAIALIATAPLSQATVYSPSQFTTVLKQKVGTKTKTAAANAAANFYAKALGDKKNKKNASKYAGSIVKVVLKNKKVTPPSIAGVSVNTQVKGLLKGYFKGLKFSLTDKTYNNALNTLLKALPFSAKTAATSQAIYNSIKTVATKNGVSQEQVFQYYTGVAEKFTIPEPPVS